MKRLELNAKTVIAYILLAVDLCAILSFVYSIACNYGFIYGASASTVEVTEDMHLTLKEDGPLDSRDDQLFIPQGTIIEPDYIYRDRIGFYYSADGYSVEECKKMSSDEKKEKGVYYLHAKPEQFKEYDEIERLCNEAEARGQAIKTKVMLKVFIPGLGISLVWLAGWFFLTRFLCKKQMYVLLYILDVVIVPVSYLVSFTFLRH